MPAPDVQDSRAPGHGGDDDRKLLPMPRDCPSTDDAHRGSEHHVAQPVPVCRETRHGDIGGEDVGWHGTLPPEMTFECCCERERAVI